MATPSGDETIVKVLQESRWTQEPCSHYPDTLIRFRVTPLGDGGARHSAG